MQTDITVDALYTAINTLPRKKQLKLLERFIVDKELLSDLIDIQIIKERMNEPSMDYEEYRKQRINRQKIQS
jgi:hypothetical protein